MKLTDQLNDDLEQITRHSLGFRALLARIGQARDGHPRAASYEGTRSSGYATVKFCERCQSDPEDCECGIDNRITSTPSVSDPTGELAVRLASKPDRARIDLARARKAVWHVTQARKILDALGDGYPEFARHASWVEREDDTGHEPGCRSCAQLSIRLKDGTTVPRWEPVWRDGLCRWCYDYRRKVGSAPDLGRLQAHHDGKRVTIPVTKIG